MRKVAGLTGQKESAVVMSDVHIIGAVAIAIIVKGRTGQDVEELTQTLRDGYRTVPPLPDYAPSFFRNTLQARIRRASGSPAAAFASSRIFSAIDSRTNQPPGFELQLLLYISYLHLLVLIYIILICKAYRDWVTAHREFCLRQDEESAWVWAWAALTCTKDLEVSAASALHSSIYPLLDQEEEEAFDFEEKWRWNWKPFAVVPPIRIYPKPGPRIRSYSAPRILHTHASQEPLTRPNSAPPRLDADFE